MKYAFKLTILFILSGTLLLSCKKEKKDPDPVTIGGIEGNWIQKSPDNTTRRISFGIGRDFSMITALDNDHVVSLHGKYTLNGSTVDISITESVNISFGQRVSTAVNQKVYDKAVFNVSGDKLTLKFVGYPSAGTSESQAVFARVILTD